MKRIISVLLVLTMALTMFVACETGKTDETTTTTPKKTTTTRPPLVPGDELPDDKILIKETEYDWKCKTVTVTWEGDDYLTRSVDGFGDFVSANPDWMKPGFDDEEWITKAAPFGDRISQSNADAIGWTNDNHGLFVRTTFALTKEDIDSIKDGKSSLYMYVWYDNTCYIYINGTEVFVHDDSDLFQEGTPGNSDSLGVHDWLDGYESIYFDGSDEHQTYEGNIADILVEGQNTFAVSLLDCWGGREFDLGLAIEYKN